MARQVEGKIQIRYVGKKRQKRDTTSANSGIVWYGHGDIKTVTEEIAALLLQHPDVWEAVDSSHPLAKKILQSVQVDTDDFTDKPMDELEVYEPKQPVTKKDNDVVTGNMIDESLEDDLDDEEDIVDAEVNEPVKLEKLTSAKELVKLLIRFPDKLLAPNTGRPKVVEVRRLAANPDLTVKQINTLWEKALPYRKQKAS